MSCRVVCHDWCARPKLVFHYLLPWMETFKLKKTRQGEEKTNEIDAVGFYWLSMMLYPLIAGWALYVHHTTPALAMGRWSLLVGRRQHCHHTCCVPVHGTSSVHTAAGTAHVRTHARTHTHTHTHTHTAHTSAPKATVSAVAPCCVHGLGGAGHTRVCSCCPMRATSAAPVCLAAITPRPKEPRGASGVAAHKPIEPSKLPQLPRLTHPPCNARYVMLVAPRTLLQVLAGAPPAQELVVRSWLTSAP